MGVLLVVLVVVEFLFFNCLLLDVVDVIDLTAV